MRDTVIVVPCYNEEKRLPVREFLSFVQEYKTVDFLFVDDGSIDGTAEIINELCLRCPGRMKLLHLPENVGKAEAVRAGFLASFPLGYDKIGFWDADLATPLVEIAEFIQIIQDSDVEIVMGSRIRLMGRKIERQPLRHYLGRIFATIASISLGITVYDTQCGAKIFRNDKLLQKILAKPFIVKWIFDVEILARYIIALERSEVKLTDIVVEKPLKTWTDIPGSKLKYTDFLRAIVELIVIWRYKRRALIR